MPKLHLEAPVYFYPIDFKRLLTGQQWQAMVETPRENCSSFFLMDM